MVDTNKPDGLAEDVLGFGGRELVTARDVLLRPRTVLAAWMEQGPEGGGFYSRPLRLYLGLNAILMLVLFLQGGAGFLLDDLPPELMTSLLEQSGKSRDAFVGDADGWMTLVMVPLLSLFYALASAPLLRLWDPDDLGWRRGFRAAFAWLCAWTVPMLPIAWWGFGRGTMAAIVAAAIFLLGLVAFVRMGQGRWFRSRLVGVGKALLLMIAVQIAGMVGGALVVAIGVLGASAAP
ncbi:hypothetical protein MMB232_03222 [Brevundimonas subvibrioides]|uniref:Yip1 domain-containing protein n=1 Tax=Brevundimonas subvibrioides (strain ATCC 15264 / DSM 4735 / LMG 14903 / NBRC 16000 / CB 81) TaxID=633149 RepID=D9QG76_BRESC|nr:hypothetical protein [Brevundimonas subvibrioides]ADL02618.1 hypothetical protein Bresu_3312 [Brevundimonas subvibrioides ATCC 15264]